MLVALLFRLAIEGRATQVGLLLAVGFGRRRVARLLLAEGLIVAALAGLAGVGLGVGYAMLMLAGLQTWWLAAIVAPFLHLHVTLPSLLIGYASGVLVAGLVIVASVRWIGRLAPRRLLAGQIRGAGTRGRGDAGTRGREEKKRRRGEEERSSRCPLFSSSPLLLFSPSSRPGLDAAGAGRSERVGRHLDERRNAGGGLLRHGGDGPDGRTDPGARPAARRRRGFGRRRRRRKPVASGAAQRGTLSRPQHADRRPGGRRFVPDRRRQRVPPRSVPPDAVAL